MVETKYLVKLTAIKLRELAKEYPDIQGAHAMKKGELIAAICAARGEAVPAVKKYTKKKTAEKSVAGLKKEIRELKAEKEKALASKDRKLLKKIRRNMKKLKRDTRKVAAAK